MTDPLWQKSGVAIDARVMKFLAGDDVLLDREFFRHDIAASGAHVEGLARIGLLSGDEEKALKRELSTLDDLFAKGVFVLDERFEDGHSAIEYFLTDRLGDTGRKVHTGRSRNDQVLVATRLWLKEKLATLSHQCKRIAKVCVDRADRDALPMPGYTHLQRAVPSSTAMWFAGFGEA
ncbi:MAG TPA: lyase family protein, partial [Rudaea sp.]|nr:lyase family protein [Rudaea sp.]